MIVNDENIEIDWKKLADEVEALKTNSNTSLKEFAGEASEIIEKKDMSKLKLWLSKWIPCIGGFVETSYYILEISKTLGII